MDKYRKETLAILFGAGLFLIFVIWLAFAHFWWFLGLCVCSFSMFLYGIKHAEVVAPDDDKYDKKD